MKIQLFSYPSANNWNVLRLKDGKYDLVHILQAPCTAPGRPVSQTWAKATDKKAYFPLITSAHIGRLEYGLPADAEIYTMEEVHDIDRKKRK